MNLKRLFLTAVTLLTVGNAISIFAQTTVYVQSRITISSAQANNPDFVCTKFASGASGNKSAASGQPAGSTSSRFVATPTNSTALFTVSPNNTTAGQLVNGTTYAVAITFATSGSGGQAESSDIVVTTSDTQTTGNDTFAGTTSAFKSGYGANSWITIGNVTVNGTLPTFTFAWQSGTNINRWYADTVRFTPLPPSSAATPQYWDTAGSIGGTGTWDATTPNWNPASNGSGINQAYVQADLADFSGPAGTVSITGGGITTDGGLEFDSTGYVIQSGPLTLGLGTNIEVAGSGTTATINSVVTGVNGLDATGSGTLVLGNTNNLTGTVTLSAGTLSLGTNETFSSLAGGISTTLALNTNTLTVGDSTTNSFSGGITDTGASTPGTLIKQGSGTLILNGITSTFHGTTTVNAGALTIASDAALGTPPAAIVANQINLNNGGRLDFLSAFTLNAKRGITLGSGGGMLSTPGSGTTATIPGPITGSGSLTVPSGGFDLSNAGNNFGGGLYITATPLDTGGNNLCSVRFEATGASGTGKIYVQPTTGVNCTLRDFSGANVTIPNNLEFDLWTNTQTTTQIYLAGATAGATLCTITFSGNINGSAPVNIGLTAANGSNPGGVVVLSGSNTLWSGGATMFCGTLGLGSSNALGTGGLAIAPQNGSNDLLIATVPLTGASAVTNPVVINCATGSFTIGGTNDLELAGPAALAGSYTISVANTGATILSGGIADFPATTGDVLTTAGPGTLTLKGASTYDGGTTISSGTLKVNNTSGSGTGSGAVIVAAGATLGGSGTISGTVDVSGILSPGNSPGALATGAQTWEGGGSYTWEINKAGGAAGVDPGWDAVNITGGLLINANSGNLFTINITSLTLADAAGAVADFSNTQAYTWSIAHVTGGITSFDPTAFTLNTSGFANSLGSGSFSITASATDILLHFIPPNAGTITSSTLSGTTLTLSGSGGPHSGTFHVRTSVNVGAPLASWTTLGTAGSYDPSGNFTYPITINPSEPQRYYILVSP